MQTWTATSTGAHTTFRLRSERMHRADLGAGTGASTEQDPIAGPEPRLGTHQRRHTHRNTMIYEVQIALKLPERNNALFA